LSGLRATAGLEELLVLRKGNRLSITPVEARHWQLILQRLDLDGDAAP
jgi:predicted RNA-binding protein with PUA-like domain